MSIGNHEHDNKNHEHDNKVDLVLEGGGVKGIGLLGAVLALVDAGYTFPRVAGTSSGAVVASLVAAYQKAGLDLHELVGVMNRVDYSRFADRSALGQLAGRLGDGVEVLLHAGAHTGDYLADWLGPELAKAGVTTFADLASEDPGTSLEPDQRYALVVHASDVSRRALVRLPWDYRHYDLAPGEQEVVGAVRASTSIPFYFRPVQVATGRGTATWVDGSLLSNFPITVFDRTDGHPPRWPTWGVKLSGEPALHAPDRPVRTAPGMALSYLKTLTSDWNRYSLADAGVNRRTIYVDTTGVPATAFDLDERTRQALFANGQAAARRFLDIQRQLRKATPTVVT
jgi:NTE family protein